MTDNEQFDERPSPGSGEPAAAAAGGSTKKGIAIGAASAVLVVVVLGGAFALGRAGQDSNNATTTTSTTTSAVPPTTAASPTTTTAAATTTAAPPTAPPAPARPDDVTALPAGLMCQDLSSRGYSYSEAVDYWRAHGRPASMDADSNTIPCETVYSSAQVTSFWGVDPGVIDKPFLLEPGLRCADLKAAGFDAYGAIEYYYHWDMPSNMDDDGDGIPCESVYPDAATAWYEY